MKSNLRISFCVHSAAKRFALVFIVNGQVIEWQFKLDGRAVRCTRLSAVFQVPDVGFYCQSHDKKRIHNSNGALHLYNKH